MKRILVTFLLSLLFINLCFSQSVHSTLLNKKTKKPINDAVIYNKSKEIITHTDEKGKFNVEAKMNDSLYIYKLGYNFKNLIGSELKDTIYLEKTVKQIDDVYVTDKKPDIILKHYKKNHSYYANPQSIHAFRIKIPTQSVITSIELPIKIKSKAHNEGKIIFQLFSAKNGKPDLKRPITEEKVIKNIKDLKRKIVLNFTNFNSNDDNYKYLVIQRLQPRLDKSETKHNILNPIIKTNRKSVSNKNYMVRVYGSTKWLHSNEVYGNDFNLRICYKVYGYKL